MKTKKAILEWWQSRGRQSEDLNDYKDFWNGVDKDQVAICESQSGQGEKQRHVLTLMTNRWKYPLRLYFHDLECYRIVGF